MFQSNLILEDIYAEKNELLVPGQVVDPYVVYETSTFVWSSH